MFTLFAAFECISGTCLSGSAWLFLDTDADSLPDPSEILCRLDPEGMTAGDRDILSAALVLGQGWFPAAGLAAAEGDTIHSDDLLLVAVAPGGGCPAVITEAMANPLDEDTGEFIEIAYAGPGLYPLAGCHFTDGDALDQVVPWTGGLPDPDVLVSQWLPSGRTAVILDSEYMQGGMPYDLPESTYAFTTSNTTLGNGLAVSDPLVLYGPTGTGASDIASTYGTPVISDDPLLCDDDGLDGIPFDPGDGFSVERIVISGPDAEYNWQASAAGGSPGVPPGGAGSPDVEATGILVSPEHPGAGEPFSISASFLNAGPVALEGAMGVIFLDSDADSAPQPGEILLEAPLDGLAPGSSDTLSAMTELADGFWLAGASASCQDEEDPSDNLLLLPFETGDGQEPVITEVCANPVDEDREEFVEIYFPGPGLYDLGGCSLTDGDAVDEIRAWDPAGGMPSGGVVPGRYLQPGCYGVVLDPEYTLGSQPYDFAPGTVLLTVGNTTLGNGLSCTDPVVLYSAAGTTAGCIVSTYGTPVLSDDPLSCDDDGLDGIPFDPGQGMSVQRISALIPDVESNWTSGPATPGGPVQGCQPGTGFSLIRLGLEPPMGLGGEAVCVSTSILNCGTDTVAQGALELLLYADLDLSGTPGAGETIAEAQPEPPLPGDTSVVSAWWVSAPSCVPVRASILCPADTCLSDDTLSTLWNRPFDSVINEVMYSPDPGQEEWLELTNASSSFVDLTSWLLSDSRTTTSLCPDGFGLPPGAFAVVTSDSSGFREAWPDVACPVLQPPEWPTLNDQTQQGEDWADDIRLSLPSGQVCDRVPYDDSWGGGSGISLEKLDPALPGFLPSSWAPCSCSGTPGRRNSVCSGGASGGAFLAFSPDPFSPDGDGVDEVLNIQLELPCVANELTLVIYNVQGRPVRTLMQGVQCGARATVLWDGTADGGARLPVGRYIVYARAVPSTGDVIDAASVVVLARRL